MQETIGNQRDYRIFFNGVGTFLRFEVEEPQQPGRGGKGGPPGPRKDDGKDAKYDEDRDSYPKEDKPRRGNGKFDRFGKIDKEGESSYGEYMEDNLEAGSKE